MAADENQATQLSIALRHSPDSAAYYFVAHSGALDAQSRLIAILAEFARAGGMHHAHLLSDAGLGKSHLLGIIRGEAANLGIAADVAIFDDPLREQGSDEDEVARRFIDAHERANSQGGVVIFASRELPQNPHIASRLLRSECIRIAPPREEELRPLIISLLERLNLRLTESDLEYLLERTPANPLCLSRILGKIDDLSLAQGKPAKRRILREVLNRENSRQR